MPLPPKPENAVFGILIDGTPRGIGFSSLKEAEAARAGLVARGLKVQIFDKVTKQIVKALP
jgi:hypothetical protein